MKDEKNLNSTKMDQKEKTPDRQKKKNPGRGKRFFSTSLLLNGFFPGGKSAGA
jgi:hypothetical protein